MGIWKACHLLLLVNVDCIGVHFLSNSAKNVRVSVKLIRILVIYCVKNEGGIIEVVFAHSD